MRRGALLHLTLVMDNFKSFKREGVEQMKHMKMGLWVIFICLSLNTAWAAKPNILFLLSDDHSAPFLGAYGNEDVRTPNLDQWASEGIRFDRMFATSPSCVPARVGLMTGRSPIAVRMGRFTSPLPADIVALPDLLRERGGYFVGVGGREYHLDGPPTSSAPEVGGILDQYNLRTFDDRMDYVQRARLGPSASLAAFLDVAPTGKPWFFWLNFDSPHHPWNQMGLLGMPDASKLTVPGYLPNFPGVREDLAKYIAEIEYLDVAIRDVLALLSQRGLSKNTVVVFMGDNGMAFPHGKGTLYDPGVNVPLLVRWPGVIFPGRVTKELVSGEDFAPTMLEIAGVNPPEEMTGVSFLKLLKGNPAFNGRRYVFSSRTTHGGDGNMSPNISTANFDLARAVRSANYKLIYNTTPHQPVAPPDSYLEPSWVEMKSAFAAGALQSKFVKAYFTKPRPTYELYKLDTDPNELTNLSGNPQYAQILLGLKKALTEKMVLDWDYLPTPLK